MWPRCVRLAAAVMLALAAVAPNAAVAADGEYIFENLGAPMVPREIPIEAVTVSADGQTIAWGSLSDPDHFAVIGVDAATGASIRLDLMRYKRSSQIRMVRGRSGHLYLYAGSPARYFKYDVDRRELVDLGRPASPARYVNGHALAPDGRFYVGSYPATNLVSVDTATDRTHAAGRMADDPRQKYIVLPAVSDDNIVYVPVGLHHAELWAYNPATGEKRQILTDDLMRNQGVVKVFLADDGQVYGEGFGSQFRCHPDRIEPVSTLPAPREDLSQVTLDGRVYRRIDPDGSLVIEDTNADTTRRVPTDARGIGVMIYSISGIHDGKLWGGGMSPARTWTYDLATGAMEDWGRLVRPQTQVYDTLFHERGLFLSSYLGAHVDLLDPRTRKLTHVVSLKATNGQERLPHFLMGPDGHIYGPTQPLKGHLTGGIVRINPQTLDYAWFPVIEDLAPTSLVVVPGTTLLFGTTSIISSTGAIPAHEEASVFLWDTESREVVWRASPITGTRTYRWACADRNGLLYAVSDDERYFVFDPSQRRVVHTGELPAPKGNYTSLMARQPMGPRGLIVGLLRGLVFAIDPVSHDVSVIARHPSILRDEHVTDHTTRAIWGSPEGVLYYGAGPELWRVNLSP